jgi:hypothetical protein
MGRKRVVNGLAGWGIFFLTWSQSRGLTCQHDSNRVDPIMTRTRLAQTQTLYFRVVFMSGSRIVSKIANPSFGFIFGFVTFEFWICLYLVI